MSVSPLLVSPRRHTALQIREIRCREEWNAIVTGVGGHVRQSWEWGVFGGRPGHRLAIAAAGHAVAAIAMSELSIPGFGFTVLEAPRGPVIGPRTPAVFSALVETIREAAQRRGAVFVRLSPGVRAADAEFVRHLEDVGAVPLHSPCTPWNVPRIAMTLSIAGSETDVKRAMRDSTRLSLRKATSLGATIERLTDEAGRARMHRLLTETGRRRAHAVRGLHRFEALSEQCFIGGAGVAILARYEGRDIAGVFGVRFGRTGYLLYSAIDPDFRALSAGVAVHWDLIRWAREQGCDRMDWGESVTSYPPTPRDVGYGIFDLRRGFGGDVTLLAPYIDIVLRPNLYRAFRLVERRGGWLAALGARLN